MQNDGEVRQRYMTPNQRIWALSRDHLAAAVSSLGYPEEFADLLAKQLGSPKAIDRLTSYLYQAKPGTVEMIIDEMLAIRSDIETWKEKKESQEAQARYNSWLNSEARWQNEEDGERSPRWIDQNRNRWERLDDKLDELIGCLEEMTEDGEDPPDGGCR